MTPRILVIFGSARNDGNTMRAVRAALGERPATIVDLAQTNLTHYDYQHRNLDDAYLGIVEQLLAADLTIFASPVYWYSMSAHLKMFFDRFSDLLTVHKDVLDRLQGKQCCVIASGSGPRIPDCFEAPFSRTFDYLGMVYRGSFYLHTTYKGDDAQLRQQETAAAAFLAAILPAAATPAAPPPPPGNLPTPVAG